MFRKYCLVLASLVLVQGAWAHAHIRQATQIPMRDAPYTLAADIYLPAATGTWPVILIQTPYNKDLFIPIFVFEFSDDPLLESPDYAFVVLDWRGFFDSAGAAYSGSPTRGEDGYDAVEWIAQQPWCNGNVGTWGASALGTIQLKTAAEQPPHLKGCVPMVYHYREWYDQAYPGGVYARDRNDFVYGLFGGLSLVKAHPLYDTYWHLAEDFSGDPSLVNVPMLHITGWYDHEPTQTMREMHDVQTMGGPNAQGYQKILVGPWSHSHVGELNQGELEFPGAEHQSSLAAVQFFDHYLRGIDNAYVSQPTVRYYRINDDRWLHSEQWPPADTQSSTLYLTETGALDSTSPVAASASLTYTADPSDPVPTLFGAVLQSTATQGPGDLQSLHARSDVLVFRTPVLTQPMSIEGQVTAHVFVECDAVDTDLALRLTDIYPDGRSILITDGIQRVSLAANPSSRATLAPGTIYDVTVSLYPTAVTIPAGHRLGLLVASSNFDRYDVNMQDGSDLSDDAGAVATAASVTFHLDATHPSRLVLPLVRFALTLQGDSEVDAQSGEDVHLEFTVDGRTTGLNYQWYRDDGQGGRTPIDGATTPQLTLSAVDHLDSGLYVLVVTDGTQVVESSLVVLNVDGPTQVPIPPTATILLWLTLVSLGTRYRRRFAVMPAKETSA
ncbi:MAG: CocE/NonD family hydrolase [Candidatus Hydrogenedentes bacterium]|nr:CocE/NonD family hydrolase [Candidatus Hydrogenedentota bacterium]